MLQPPTPLLDNANTFNSFGSFVFALGAAWQMVIATYENSDDPFQKMNAIFTNHISMSRRIKPDVIKYMAENWAEWERTKPSWFTPGFISKIPDEFIPQQNLEALGGARRRRSSVNSVRELLNLADE